MEALDNGVAGEPHTSDRRSVARLQRSRRRGWRMPAGAIYVGRPTKWGNPFAVGPAQPVAQAVDTYRTWMAAPAQQHLRQAARAELAGHDLVCWCPANTLCHADILLELANMS